MTSCGVSSKGKTACEGVATMMASMMRPRGPPLRLGTSLAHKRRGISIPKDDCSRGERVILGDELHFASEFIIMTSYFKDPKIQNYDVTLDD